MNYLAHLYLADLNNDSLIGHFLGDFVKGRRLNLYESPVRDGILFHRKIDSFSDSHPVIQRSRNRFDPPLRRFAGVIVDVSYDHFLSRYWSVYSAESLCAFTRRVYAQLNRGKARLTERAEFVLSRMIGHDWLNSYFYLENVGLALDRIASRLTRGASFMGSLASIENCYQDLLLDFQQFFPELVAFSRNYKQSKTRHSSTNPPIT